MRTFIKEISFKSILKLLIVLILIILIVIISSNDKLVRAESADSLEIGQYVKFGKYLGEPIVWRVIHRVEEDEVYKEGESTDIYKIKGIKKGDLLLLSDRIISFKCFDSKDEKESDNDRKIYGSNNWATSNLRDWLNSKDHNVSWTTKSPSDNNTIFNAYSEEEGFLGNKNFIQEERNIIENVTHKYMINPDLETKDGGNENFVCSCKIPSIALQNYDNASYKNSTEKVFIPNIKELANYVEGKLTYDNGEDYYFGYTTDMSRSQSDGTVLPQTDDEKWHYSLRDQYLKKSYIMRSVLADGKVNGYYAFNVTVGVRPALYINTKGVSVSNESGENSQNSVEFLIDNGKVLGIRDNDRKNFKYYIGKDNRGIVKIMLVSKTGKDLKFNKDDILELSGDRKNYFKEGIIYIDEEGEYKRYEIFK